MKSPHGLFNYYRYFIWLLFFYNFQPFPYSFLFQLLSATTLLGAIFCFSAFCFKSMYTFLAIFAVGELLVFATQVRSFYLWEILIINFLDKELLSTLLFLIHLYGLFMLSFCRLLLILSLSIVLNLAWGHYLWPFPQFQFTFLVMYLLHLLSVFCRFAFITFDYYDFFFNKWN